MLWLLDSRHGFPTAIFNFEIVKPAGKPQEDVI